MENIDWGSILSVVFGLATTILAGVWLKAKGVLGKVKVVAKEGYEAIKALVEALDDDKLTAEEQASIKKEALEAWAAIKDLLRLGKDPE